MPGDRVAQGLQRAGGDVAVRAAAVAVAARDHVGAGVVDVGDRDRAAPAVAEADLAGRAVEHVVLVVAGRGEEVVDLGQAPEPEPWSTSSSRLPASTGTLVEPEGLVGPAGAAAEHLVADGLHLGQRHGVGADAPAARGGRSYWLRDQLGAQPVQRGVGSGGTIVVARRPGVRSTISPLRVKARVSSFSSVIGVQSKPSRPTSAPSPDGYDGAASSPQVTGLATRPGAPPRRRE